MAIVTTHGANNLCFFGILIVLCPLVFVFCGIYTRHFYLCRFVCLFVCFVKRTDGTQEGWNRKIVEWRLVQRFDDGNHFVMEETYKSFNSPYKFRDFVVLRCFRENYNNEGRHLMVFSSISNYDKIPESKDKLRTIILPTGFEVKPYGNDKTRSRVSFRAHMTNESILLVSADLLGETDELFQSLARIGDLVTIMKEQQSNNGNGKPANKKFNKKPKY